MLSIYYVSNIEDTLADKSDITAVTSWRMQTNRMGHYNTGYYRRFVGCCGDTQGERLKPDLGLRKLMRNSGV